MAKLRPTEAAKMAGISRTTLYRDMKSGKISHTPDGEGGRFIDSAEILRVYPPVSRVDVPELHVGTADVTPQDALVRHLEAQLQAAQQREEWLKAQLELALQKALPGPSRPWWRFWS